MNISDSLDQYADICRDAIKKSSAKLNKSFENLLVEILLLYMIIPRFSYKVIRKIVNVTR